MFFDAHAADWIAGLHFPSQAPKVLAQEKFWTLDCLGRFLGAASEFAERDPQQGREVAQIGVQLAQIVPSSTGQRQQLVRSLALLAWTHQACGAASQGEGIYRTAFELAAHAPLDPRVTADLLRRYASLLRGRGQLDSALQATDQAMLLIQNAEPSTEAAASRKLDWPLELGRVLIERALVLQSMQRVDDAVGEIGLALEALDPFRHDREITSCLDLLSRIADGTRALDRLHRIARRVAILRDVVETHQLRPGSTAAGFAARVLRLDGRLFQRMGALQRAERSLRHARRLLRGHTDDGELLALSLDLASLLATEDRQAELRRLSADTLEQVADRGGLSLTRYRWRRALASGRLDSAEIRRIRQAFAEERTAAQDAAQARTSNPGADADAAGSNPATGNVATAGTAPLRPVAVGQ